MKLSKWLTISSNGSSKITADKPDLNANQISMKINIDLPDALFERPSLVASISVPDDAAASGVIESIVHDNVGEALQAATGLTFAISVTNGTEQANG